jgi:zinc-binding in reverse transcriptase
VTDRWRGSTSLTYDFPHLFSVCKYPYITIAEVFCKGVNNLEFNSNLSISLKADFAVMVNLMINVQLDNQVVDQIKWRWNETCFFTVHSFYTWLSNGGVFSSDYEVMWKSHIPFKIQIFLWLVRKNKILTRVNLQKKDGKGVLHVYFVIRRKLQTISLCNVHMLTVFGNGWHNIIILFLLV